MQRSVVVTGIGMATCLAPDAPGTWKRLLAGERGYETGSKCAFAAGAIPESERVIALIEQATAEALADAEVAPTDRSFGVAVGSSRGRLADWEASGGKIALALDAPARTVAAQVGGATPFAALACACSSGSWAIGTGYRWIRDGYCDRALVGAADAALGPLNLAGFRQAGALASAACLPFDARRDGFVLAEGAAILVLEAASVARRPPYAEILGFAAANDAFHPTAPHPEGRGLMQAIRTCLRAAEYPAVAAIHAHGTGTRAGDPVEAAVIARLYGTAVPVIATKAALGHSLGASSAIEAALACLALRHQVLPPIAGLSEAIAELNFVRSRLDRPLASLMLHSVGFGGQNTALLLGACPSPSAALV